jgi:protein-L-isoaspartate(D-aspartate) O-methyltransferase
VPDPSRLITSLIKQGDLHDDRVIAAMQRVPRHVFVPEVPLDEAYANHPIAIGYGQTISQPTVIAIMTEALRLTGHERILEIGTGSGYQAAILACLAQHVYSIEILPILGETAQARLQTLGFTNVSVRIGDGYAGWPEHAPFDRILLTAAPRALPQMLVDQLAEGAILVAPIGGPSSTQRLLRFRKSGGNLEEQDLGAVRFVPMVRDERPKQDPA